MSDRAETEALFRAWEGILPKLEQTDHLSRKAVDHMVDHFSRWKKEDLTMWGPQLYMSILRGLSQVHDGPRALEVLEAWNEVHVGNMELAPQRDAYHLVLQAYSKGHPIQSGEVAQEVVDLMKSCGYSMEPDAETFRLAAQCISTSMLVDELPAAKDFDLLKALCTYTLAWIEKSSKIAMVENLEDLAYAMKSIKYAMDRASNDELQSRTDAAKDCFAVLNPLWRNLILELKECSSGDDSFLGALDCGTSAILTLQEIFLDSIDEVAAAQADVLQKTASLNLLLQPSLSQFLATIQTLADSDLTDGPETMQSLLQTMATCHRRIVSEEVNSSKHTDLWNDMMRAYLIGGSYDSTRKLYKEMTLRKIYRDADSLTLVLSALLGIGKSQEAAIATSLLDKILRIEQERRPFSPSADHYALVMETWLASGSVQSAYEGEKIFRRMRKEGIPPSPYHYHILIRLWGNPRDSKNVDKVLAYHADLQVAGLKPDEPTTLSVISALSGLGTREGAVKAAEILEHVEAHGVMPSCKCYTALMYAWTRSGVPEAPEECALLFNKLWDSYIARKDPNLAPTSATYRALIKAQEARIDQSATLEGESWLARMERDSSQGLVSPPNAAVYSSLIALYIKNKERPEKAEEVYRRMVESYQSGNVAAKPDAYSMTTLLRAWSTSESPDKAEKCFSLLKRMVKEYEGGDMDMRPTMFSYSAVLNACQTTSNLNKDASQKATRISLDVLKTVDSQADLSPLIFSQLLNIAGRHVQGEDCGRLCKIIFTRCSQEGKSQT